MRVQIGIKNHSVSGMIKIIGSMLEQLFQGNDLLCVAIVFK